MAKLRINLLGAPRMELNGELLALGRRKVIGLLAYLAVTAQPHSRDALAALFWPDYDQSGARANLRRDISRTRLAVGEDLLLVEGDQVRLEMQHGVWCDTAEFSYLIAQVQAHGHTLRSGSPPLDEACMQALTQAVELYQGDFMAGFSLPDSPTYDDWQFFENENLRQKLAETLQHLIYWHARSAEYERALEYARRWQALDPLHEPAARQLMQLYAWAGQQAAALRQYQDLARLLKKELGVSPEEDTQQLYQAIQNRELNPPAPNTARPLPGPQVSAGGDGAALAISALQAPQHNLPPQVTPFIGREQELEYLLGLLRADQATRVVTVLGPGGSGKTRLALELARKIANSTQPDFNDGVWFVPLAPIHEVEGILPAIDQVLQFSGRGEQADLSKQFTEYIKNKRLLLVLDNMEQLVTPAAQELIGDLLLASPKTKLLVTSRVRLNSHGEQVYPLEGLRVPDNSLLLADQPSEEAIAPYSALRLFLQSARRVQPDFKLSADNLPVVVRICQLVQGMPLGIELAAAWLEMLTPEEIVAEIERCLDFLEADWHDMPDRQRSLRAVFNSSWNLLGTQEREFVAALSIFVGSFSREAAQEVSTANLRDLLGLAHKSWLQRTADGRFMIHELLRQYAIEQLEQDSGEWRRVRTRHATYYADFLAAKNQDIKGPRQKEAFHAIGSEFDHIRVAWNWMVENHQFELIIFWMLPAIFQYCEARISADRLFPLLNTLHLALEENPHEPTDQRAMAIVLTARSAFYTNGYPIRHESFGTMAPSNRELLTQAWALGEKLELESRLCYWRVLGAYLYGRIINQDQGIQALNVLIPMFQEAGRTWDLALSYALLGQLEELELESKQEMLVAGEHLQQAIDLFTSLGDMSEAGHAERSLGNLRRFQGEPKLAITCWKSSQEKLEAAGEWTIANDINWQLGDMYVEIGEFEAAFEHYRTMSQTYVASGHLWLAGREMSKESYEALRYGDLDRAWETRLLSLEYCRAAGDTFGEAWSTWELGEYYRVAGNPQQARQAYEEALVLFDKVSDRNGHTFYHRGLGDLALMEGQYATALDEFQQSIEFSQETEHLWGLAYAQYGAGYAAAGLGDLEQATHLLTLALRLSFRTGHKGIMLLVLSGVAFLQQVRGELEQAVETLSFLVSHFATWYDVRRRAKAQLKELEAALPPEAYQAALERGRQRQIESFGDLQLEM
jgi:predicted ATPase/DNA-binding SARP family transcriptional activator